MADFKYFDWVSSSHNQNKTPDQGMSWLFGSVRNILGQQASECGCVSTFWELQP